MKLVNKHDTFVAEGNQLPTARVVDQSPKQLVLPVVVVRRGVRFMPPPPTSHLDIQRYALCYGGRTREQMAPPTRCRRRHAFLLLKIKTQVYVSLKAADVSYCILHAYKRVKYTEYQDNQGDASF